jgi:DNA-binding NarL/FixJ family response regulator
MDRTINQIKDLIQDEELLVIGDSSTGSIALDKIENASPDIVIMPLGVGDTDVLSLAERIILDRPRIHIILVTEHMDVDILQSAIKIGAHNVIEFPKNAKDFAEYIKSVFHTENARINSLSEGKKTLSWMSRVVTIFGPKWVSKK